MYGSRWLGNFRASASRLTGRRPRTISALHWGTLGGREAGTARLEEAIEAYRNALLEYTPERVPLQWAMTLDNLGVAWSNLPSGDRDANLRQAIACYEAALRVRSETDFPLDWAMTQSTLGNAWSDLPSGNRDANLRQASACYEAALRVYTETDFPREYEIVRENLRRTHSDL
jgi:tetratricopeptide (TPR) repeat protein